MKLLHKLHAFFSRLFLVGSSSSVSVVFAKLELSLLSYSGASTIIVVKSSQLSLKVFFKSFFFKGWMMFKKTFCNIKYLRHLYFKWPSAHLTAQMADR